MPPARFFRLTPEEDGRLREIEQDPHPKPKVRLRAQVLRLSGRGEGVERVALTPAAEPGKKRLLARPRPLGGAGPRGPGRRDRPGQPAAHHRGSGGLHGTRALRGRAHLERHPAPRSARGAFRDRGHAGGRTPTPPRHGLPLETHPLRARPPARRRTPKRNAEPEPASRGAKKGARKKRHERASTS
jgi:hypothetical protein